MTYESWAWALRTKDGKWREWTGCPTSRLRFAGVYETRKCAVPMKYPGDRVVRVRVTMEVEE